MGEFPLPGEDESEFSVGGASQDDLNDAFETHGSGEWVDNDDLEETDKLPEGQAIEPIVQQ